MNKYYRNQENIQSDQGVEIDQGSLWQYDANSELLVLVDEDEYHTHVMTDIFVEEKNN